MSGRTFLLIFFFWAVLAIITPTLVLWSESAKPNFDVNGKKSEEMNARKMMGYLEKRPKIMPIAHETAEAPAPAPAPEPVHGVQKLSQRSSHSNNETGDQPPLKVMGA